MRYIECSEKQKDEMIEMFRKKIFFLLVCVDKKTNKDYQHVNIEEAFDSLLTELGGLNDLMSESHSLIYVMSLLSAALLEYRKNDFDFRRYRKLILDAGVKMKEV